MPRLGPHGAQRNKDKPKCDTKACKSLELGQHSELQDESEDRRQNCAKEEVDCGAGAVLPQLKSAGVRPEAVS